MPHKSPPGLHRCDVLRERNLSCARFKISINQYRGRLTICQINSASRLLIRITFFSRSLSLFVSAEKNLNIFICFSYFFASRLSRRNFLQNIFLIQYCISKENSPWRDIIVIDFRRCVKEKCHSAFPQNE